MSIRLNLTSPSEEARAELARLQRAQRATYLGVSVWLWVALALGSATVGLALAVGGLLPEPHCGWTVEDGQRLEAGCSTMEELEERLGSIRHSRSGLRDWEDGL